MYAPMVIRKHRLFRDWTTDCQRCGLGAVSSDWEGAMVMALGHMSMFHPQWPSPEAHWHFEVPC